MSGFVRRAQRKVAKLEAQLAAARAEVTRQTELDIERAAAKVVHIAERKAQKKAERAADPERIRLETLYVLMKICVKLNLKCETGMVDSYMAWKKTVEFPPNTNLYQKCSRFIQETILSEEVGIPIYAKTMTGELIPLVYHPHYDVRELLIQLYQISPEEFPIGSTSVRRLSDEPVQEGDVFGLFRHGAEVVSYSQLCPDAVELSDHVVITYKISVNPEGLVRGVSLGLKYPLQIILRYSPADQMISCHRWSFPLYPMSEFENQLRILILYDYSSGYSFSLTDQARQEVMDVFETIRHRG